MRATAIAFVLLFASASAFAKQGLVVHFTIKKILANKTTTYTNGVLMKLTESSSFTFPGLYEMRLESRALAKDKENIVVTLKDISSGKPIYAGSNVATVKIGDMKTISLHELHGTQTQYEVTLDTSYGELPNS